MNSKTEQALGRYLSVRIRSREEISRYLTRKKVEKEEIETILNRWTELGIVNDDEFCDAVVRVYLRKGKGPLHIRAKLVEAGVSREQIKNTLLAIPKEDIKEAMAKRLEKARSRLEGLQGYQKRLKAMSWLSSSGFLSGEVTSFIDDWMAKE